MKLPNNPKWADRDRFVLSNGHASMLLYSLLHLTGYDVSIDDIRNFRQLHSKTAGHPEYGECPGVETTTGPLGQGLANGLPVKYHSISFYDREDQERFEEILQATPPGETVTLQHPPDIINVELFPDFPGDSDKERMKNKARRDRWLDGSITEDGRVVIPITVSNKKYVKWKKSQIRGGGRSRFMPSKVDLADYFPIEPGFSITLHKAQVSFLLCFSRHNISLAERYFVRGSHT